MKRNPFPYILITALSMFIVSCGGPSAPSSQGVPSSDASGEHSHDSEESEAHVHAYDGYEHDDTDHWQVCSVCGETTAKEHHRGGTADCVHRAVCEICGVEYGALDEHDFGAWEDDPGSGEHVHACSVCGQEEREAHVFDREVVDPAYLVGEFIEGCEVTNVYYKSCFCGASSNDPELTFSVDSHHEYTLAIVLEGDANLLHPATCTEAAVYGYVCEKCHTAFSTEKTFSQGEPAGHHFEYFDEDYTFATHHCAYAYCDECDQYFLDVSPEGAAEPDYQPADPSEIFDDDHGQYGMEEYGSEEKPYRIVSEKDLFAFRSAVNNTASPDNFAGKTLVLENDLELTEDKEFGDCIANDDKHPFSGTFDGQGHTISNFLKTKNASGTESAKDAVALFSRVTGGTIKNLKLDNYTATGNNQRIAGFVARAFDATILNCEVLSGTITGAKQVGGIAAAAFGTTVIRGCVNRATIVSAGVGNGGIVGHEYSGDLLIENCTNYGRISVSGSGSAGLGSGGILGNTNAGAIASTLPDEHNAAATIRNCVNEGEIISSGEATGGIAGQVGIASGAAERSFLIADCTNKGHVKGSGNGTGGVLGSSGTASSFVVTIEGCSNEGFVEGAAYVGGIVGLQRKNVATSEILECDNAGDVSGSHSVGGIVGLTRMNVTDCQTLNSSAITVAGASSPASDLQPVGSKNVAGYLVGVVENAATVTGTLYSAE